MYIFGIKILCVTLAVISVIYFELSYRKDNGYLFMHGVEFLVIATITLFSVYAYSLFYITYNNILSYILIVVFVYYIIKTILTLRNMKKEYYKLQNDIKEIVKKGSRKMIRSMTGYGRGKYEIDSREYIVEIKSVNNRYSDISIKLPRSISYLEEKIKKR